MITWYITMIIGLLLVFAVLFWQYRGAIHQKIILATSLLVMACALMTNFDILKWYQFLEQQKALHQAQDILKQPQKVEYLLERLKQTVAKHPEDVKAWFLLGRIYAANNDWAHAHDALLQAYRQQPDDVKTALFYVETIWHTQGHITKQAHMILQSVLKKQPNQPDALLLLATDAKQHQCYQQAIVYWKRVLVMFAKDSEMYKILLEAIENAQKQTDHCQQTN